MNIADTEAPAELDISSTYEQLGQQLFAMNHQANLLYTLVQNHLSNPKEGHTAVERELVNRLKAATKLLAEVKDALQKSEYSREELSREIGRLRVELDYVHSSVVRDLERKDDEIGDLRAQLSESREQSSSLTQDITMANDRVYSLQDQFERAKTAEVEAQEQVQGFIHEATQAQRRHDDVLLGMSSELDAQKHHSDYQHRKVTMVLTKLRVYATAKAWMLPDWVSLLTIDPFVRPQSPTTVSTTEEEGNDGVTPAAPSQQQEARPPPIEEEPVEDSASTDTTAVQPPPPQPTREDESSPPSREEDME
jgi:myosin heavy subunit